MRINTMVGDPDTGDTAELPEVVLERMISQIAAGEPVEFADLEVVTEAGLDTELLQRAEAVKGSTP